jgi:hypothetical protein
LLKNLLLIILMFIAATIGGIKAYTEYAIKQKLQDIIYQQVKLSWLGDLQITGIKFNQNAYAGSVKTALITQVYRTYLVADRLEFSLIGLELSIPELTEWLSTALKLDLNGSLRQQAKIWHVQLDLHGQAGYELIVKLQLQGDLTAWEQMPIQNIELIYTAVGLQPTAEQLNSVVNMLRLLPLNTTQLAAVEQIIHNPKQLNLNFNPPEPYPNYADLTAKPLEFINYITLKTHF